MRMTLSIDSATADEAKDLIFAWQRTRHFGKPASPTDDPTVRMAGIGWGVTLPPCDHDRAQAIMADFSTARAEAAHRKAVEAVKTQTQPVETAA